MVTTVRPQSVKAASSKSHLKQTQLSKSAEHLALQVDLIESQFQHLYNLLDLGASVQQLEYSVIQLNQVIEEKSQVLKPKLYHKLKDQLIQFILIAGLSISILAIPAVTAHTGNWFTSFLQQAPVVSVQHSQSQVKLSDKQLSEIEQSIQVISKVESGGKFNKLGESGKLGYFQISPDQLKAWSHELLGSEVPPAEYLQSPKLQYRLGKAKLSRLYKAELAHTQSSKLALKQAITLFHSDESSPGYADFILNKMSKPAESTTSVKNNANPDNSQALDSETQLQSLFATPKAIGSLAIGAAEGNYDLNGNRTQLWYGHTDPGDNKHNQGFCSIAPGRDADFKGGSSDDADAACIKMLQRKMGEVFADFSQAGVSPTLEYALSSMDLYNQASPEVSKRFPAMLAKHKASGKTGLDLIADARTEAFYKDGRNTATGLTAICHREGRGVSDWECVRHDQMRRATEIHRVVNSVSTNSTLNLAKELSKPFNSAKPNKTGSENIASPDSNNSHLTSSSNAISDTVSNQVSQVKTGISNTFQNILKSQADDTEANSIVAYMEKQGYKLFKNPGEVNIVYIRDSPKAINTWESHRKIIRFDNAGSPHIVFDAQATSYPGDTYIYHGRSDGAPFLKDGQYTAWSVGTHYGLTGTNVHEALVQSRPLTVYRSHKADFSDGQANTGIFGINIHGSKKTSESIDAASAGCPVTRGMKSHRRFMEIVKTDPRFQNNNDFVFTSTFIYKNKLGS